MISKFKDVKDLEKVGNKAKFLIEMKKNKFNVPDGFVLDVDTYTEIIKDNDINLKIENLLKKLTKENVNKISSQISNLFNDIEFSEKINNEIENNIDKNKLYAVRSSGTKEDLDEYSFAGQYETFLNVSYEDLKNKIINCYKSMFSEVILNYLLNNNISFTDMRMTVIVQEMIQSECSGICFTINPITGNDKEMVIEVGKGLGENIVSGKVAPEQYYYNWFEKKYKYDENNKLLDKKILEEMTEKFLNIQLYFGYPCDIEFGIYNNKLYILQARRITKIQYQGIKELWTTADFKDGGVSATICTPYMWSLYEYIWEYVLKKFLLESKILREKDISPKLGEMFYARCYWNLSVVKRAMSQVIGYREREFDSEYGIKMNYEGEGKTTKVTLKSLKDIIRMAIAQKKILNTRNKNAQKYKDDLLEKYYNYKTSYDNGEIQNIKETWYKLTHDDYLLSESTYFWQIFINTIHQSLYKDGLLKYVSESEYLTLLGSIENISHLLPFYDMWEISRKIRSDKKDFKYWQEKTCEEIIKDLENVDNASFESVKKLIKNYGYHSDKELDVTYKCYYEDVSPFINTLKDMCLLEDSFSPLEDKKQGKEAYEKIFNRIEKEVSKKKYNKIKDKVEKMRKMLWWREEFRDVSTRFYYIIRIYTVELSKKLVEEKVIERKEDIWFLKVADIWEYLDGKISKDDIKNIIKRNKTYYNAYKNFMSENEIGQSITSTEKNNERKSDEIKGLGANNGKVVGTARVIESFDEINKLQKDDILVTKFTDTGWTPKFAILSGIVTEYGGILCHAAIVSREYGIPAIVSCHDVMSKIKDGQKIMIDGSTGIVTIVEE
ncbi:MAG: phosphoenolpyruvate synthase [Clostridia bacterium]|nr:phosphoenolpyruvate synthase [Clostridia bacterium]